MKKIGRGWVLFFLALCAGSPSALSYENPDQEQAVGCMRHRDWDGALSHLNTAIGMSATDPSNFMLRGKCFFNMQNFQLAIEDFNKVLEFSPNMYSAFLWRGTAHARLGHDDLAAKDYEQAIRLHPALARAYFQADSNQKHSQLPGHRSADSANAIADYKRAMKLVYPQGFSSTASSRAGSPDPADDTQDEFLNADGSNPDSKAVPAAQRRDAFEIDSSHTLPSGNEKKGSGRVKRRKGQENSAGDDQGAYQATANNPKSDLSTTMAGNLDVGRSDDRLRANKDKRVTDRFDQDPDYGQFGAVPGSQPLKGDANKVISDTTEAMRIDGPDAELLFRRAKAYQKLAEVNKAYADYGEAIRLNSKAKYFVGRASLFFQLDKPMLVDADVKKAIAADPSLPREIHFGGEKYPSNVHFDGDGPNGR